MDTIRIYFEGLEPQEVRVAPGIPVNVVQPDEWCGLWLPEGKLVKFKAKMERWERVHGPHPQRQNGLS